MTAKRASRKPRLDPVEPVQLGREVVDEPVPLDFVPSTAGELQWALRDWRWRIGSGQLYWIMIKGDDTEEVTRLRFIPNAAQWRFIENVWYRNVILKARQLGFTTLISILWLDHALCAADQRCGIVAQDREAAAAIFRDKVKFAYDNLPEPIRSAAPLARESADEILFAHNNSSIRVATSMRSGTIHRLHVSEFGKIGAKYPDKAKEVITGSIPAVPQNGVLVIESTAEGQEGEFYNICKRAEALAQSGKELTVKDYKFHFEPWHANPEYEMDAAGVIITAKDHEYFDRIEGEAKTTLSFRQRAWYVATRDTDFSGDPAKMWQEYPSTPDEAFQQSTEGSYYAIQLAAARRDHRICKVRPVQHVPVNTFWDIGASDGTGIWLHQQIGVEHHFIGYIEAWGEPYSWFVKRLQELGYLWGTHYLPHDAEHKRQQGARVAAPIDMLEEMTPGWRWETIPRVDEIQHGIQRVRDVFGQCWFDEVACKDGLAHLSLYSKEWNTRLGCWKDIPKHDVHSEAADAFRQFAQWRGDPVVRAGQRVDRRMDSWKVA